MTQKGLAKATGTSQQQIQRIEAGVQTTRLDLVLRLCAALGEPMDKVFPGTKRPLVKSAKQQQTLNQLVQDEKLSKEMEAGGVDLDSRQWTIKLRLRGGRNFLYRVTGPEKDRFWSVVQNEDSGTLVFDSENKRVGLRTDCLTFTQFLWDHGSAIRDVEKAADALELFFVDGGETSLEIEPDESSVNALDESEIGDFDWGNNQLQQMFFLLETHDMDHIFHIVDIDGEDAFIPSKEIALVEVPLWAVEPGLDDGDGIADEAEIDESPESGVGIQ